MTDVMQRLSAALADRYRIERELGQGGMATVYLAHDLKHERDVAIKVLRPELGAVLGADRFLAEIKITARLDHPHILTLIDSGAAEGFLYYVLPYVRGESLRDLLDREKQLGIEQALAITRQVAGALDYAHRQGVVHRDIKPENILLLEGEAMLADFGIALAVKEAGGNRLTETGLSLGTPQYMSPEQATGDRTLDARSDVYSLAAVLYEMLAGEPPVTGPNAQAMIAKLMTERPTRLRVVRDTVSEEMDAAVAKALAKTPADRFSGTAAFAAALDAAATPPASASGAARRRRRPLLVGTVAALALAVVAYFLMADRARASTSSPFAAAIPVQLTTTGKATAGIPSPDGSQLVYSEAHCESAGMCRTDLLIRETTGEGVSTIYSQPGHFARPAGWSPDGRWVLFGDDDVNDGGRSGWYIVPQRGGVPRRVASMNTLGIPVGFVAPDTIVMTTTEGPDHWLRRFDVAAGQVVDSLLLPTPGTVIQLTPSPDGRRLLVLSAEGLADDSLTLSVVDRSGNVSESARIAVRPGFGSLFAGAVWSGSGAVIVQTTIKDENGLVATRRRLDARGRFLRGADTLTVIPDGMVRITGASADASRLFYGRALLGEQAFWTASRANPGAPYAMRRRVAASTATIMARLSPNGRWIFLASGRLFTRPRIEVEAFDTGDRQVVEPALSGMQDFAFLPSEDSLILATQGLLTGPLVFTSYPLAGGQPVKWGTFDRGRLMDLGSLPDGRLVTPVNSGQALRVFAASGDVKDVPIPDSLGTAIFSRPSPGGDAETAVGTISTVPGGLEFNLLRCSLVDGRCTLLARSRSALNAGGGTAVWSTDGWIRLPLVNTAMVTGAPTLRSWGEVYRVSVNGGTFEPEPARGLLPGSSVVGMSRDRLRALVSVQSVTSDLWMISASAPK